MENNVVKYELCAEYSRELVRESNINELSNLIHCRKMLVFYLHFEELFEIIKENFRDFWRTLFDISESDRLHLYRDRIETTKDIFNLNLRITNILNSYKSYEDHLQRRLSSNFGGNNEYKAYLKIITSEAYDNLFEYRFCVKLRNYTQHFSSPVDKLSYHSLLVRREPVEVAYTISPKIYKAKLMEYDGWSTVKAELEALEDEIELVPMFQVFFKELESIHSKMRFRLEQEYNDSKCFINNLYTECEEYLKNKNNAHNPVPSFRIYYTDNTVKIEWIPFDLIQVVDRYRKQNARKDSNGCSFTTLQAYKGINKI